MMMYFLRNNNTYINSSDNSDKKIRDFVQILKFILKIYPKPHFFFGNFFYTLMILS